MKLSELAAGHKKQKRELVREGLASNGWRLVKTARALGVHPSALVRLIRSLDLEPEYLKNNPWAGRAGRKYKNT